MLAVGDVNDRTLTTEFEIRAACEVVCRKSSTLMKRIITHSNVLPHSPTEMIDLLQHAFVAVVDRRLAAFAAIKMYSRVVRDPGAFVR